MSTDLQQLSEREREILRLVAAGLSNQQIAGRLEISINTVKVHLRNIFSKTGVASRAEAAMYAVREGLVIVDRPEQAQTADLSIETSLDQPLVEQEPETSREVEAPEAVPAIRPEPETVAPQKARPDNRRWLIAALALVVLVASITGAGTWALGWPRQADLVPRNSNGADAPAEPTRWQALPDLPSPRVAFAIANAGDLVYVAGGENQTGVLSSLERFDARFGTWTELSQKPSAVADVRAVVHGGEIYIPGGRRSGDPADISNVFERYDPRTESWERLPDLPQPRSAYALAALEGKLYLLGGWDGSSYRREVFEYDPDQNTWQERAPMPTARAYADAAVVEGSIFVLGGENETGRLASNEVYTPAQEETGPWARRAPLPQPRSRFGAAVALSIIHVIGGAPPETPPVQYDARADTWQPFEPPPEPVGDRPGVVLLETTIMSLGGQPSPATYSVSVQGYQALFKNFLPQP